MFYIIQKSHLDTSVHITLQHCVGLLAKTNKKTFMPQWLKEEETCTHEGLGLKAKQSKKVKNSRRDKEGNTLRD